VARKAEFNRRELRGLGIVAIGGQIQRLSDKLFLVKSQSTDAFHRVEWVSGKWLCDCQDYMKRSKPCKHIYAVNFLLALPKIVLSNTRALERKCPYCGSNKTILKGFRYNKAGAVRLRLCKICNKRFKDDLMADSKGNNSALAIIALDLFYKRLSLREIKNHLWQVYCVDKPVSTLHRWIVKLTETMRKALEDVTLELGDKWLGDETVVKVKGEERYLWSIMDYETRRYIASLLTEGRGAKEASSVIKKAIKKAGKQPQKLITDGLESYSKALKELPSNCIEHISNVGLAKQGDSNNRIERLQGTIKTWTKAKRGLKSRSETLLDGYHCYYNFIRPHMALSDKPPVNMNKDGRWLSFIVDK